MRAWPSDFGPSWGPCGLDVQPHNFGCRAANFTAPPSLRVAGPWRARWWRRARWGEHLAGRAWGPGSRWMLRRLVGVWRPEHAGRCTRGTGRAGQKRKVVRDSEKQPPPPSLNSAGSAPLATPESALVAGSASLLPARSSGCRHQARTGHRTRQGPPTRRQHPAHELSGPATKVMGLDVLPTRPP